MGSLPLVPLRSQEKRKKKENEKLAGLLENLLCAMHSTNFWEFDIEIVVGFPGGSESKESTCNAGDPTTFLYIHSMNFWEFDIETPTKNLNLFN